MSYDVVGYSFGTSVASPQQIEPYLGTWSVSAVSSRTNALLPMAKPFPLDCLVVGWRPKKSLPDIQALLKAKATAALDELYSKNLVFSCPLDIDKKYRPDPDELDELAEFAKPSQLNALKAARIRYGTYTSMGRNKGSLELQMRLCSALATLYGGVLEDPQVGLLQVFAKPA